MHAGVTDCGYTLLAEQFSVYHRHVLFANDFKYLMYNMGAC